MTELERLVIEWRDAQRAIDHQVEQSKQRLVLDAERRDAIARMVDAHAALIKYANEEMG